MAFGKGGERGRGMDPSPVGNGAKGAVGLGGFQFQFQNGQRMLCPRFRQGMACSNGGRRCDLGHDHRACRDGASCVSNPGLFWVVLIMSMGP
jgi:hypothetical protein